MSPTDHTNSNHPSQESQVSAEIRASSRVSVLLSTSVLLDTLHMFTGNALPS